MEDKIRTLTVEVRVSIARETAEKLLTVAKAASDFAEALAALADKDDTNDIKALATSLADLAKAGR